MISMPSEIKVPTTLSKTVMVSYAVISITSLSINSGKPV